VALDRERQPDGAAQARERQQRRLHHAERLAQSGRAFAGALAGYQRERSGAGRERPERRPNRIRLASLPNG
jgi:hypothetical protein